METGSASKRNVCFVVHCNICMTVSVYGFVVIVRVGGYCLGILFDGDFIVVVDVVNECFLVYGVACGCVVYDIGDCVLVVYFKYIDFCF